MSLAVVALVLVCQSGSGRSVAAAEAGVSHASVSCRPTSPGSVGHTALQDPAAPMGGSSAASQPAPATANETWNHPAPNHGGATVEDVMQHRRLPAGSADATRWFTVSSAAVAFRYRALAVGGGSPGISQIQGAGVFRARANLVPGGGIALHGGGSTGRGFSGGWNTTGLGTGPPARDLSLRELFLGVTPFRALEIQIGGLYILRGESTEATSYDNDGYVTGERVVVGTRWLGGLAEVSATRAYLGDLGNANVLGRFERLDRANYHQVLAVRRWRTLAMSVDYTTHAGTHVLRQGVSVDLTGRVPVRRLRVEHYVRVRPTPGYGVTVGASRLVASGTMLTAGVSFVDPEYGGLNGDFYGTGLRAFGSLSRRLGGAWSVSIQGAHGLRAGASAPRTRLDAGVAYDVAHAWRGRAR